MSVLSDINTTMNETDLFLMNKQLIECLERLSELTFELNATKLELSEVKNELSYIKKVNANLVRSCDRYYEEVDDIKEKIRQYESI